MSYATVSEKQPETKDDESQYVEDTGKHKSRDLTVDVYLYFEILHIHTYLFMNNTQKAGGVYKSRLTVNLDL